MQHLALIGDLVSSRELDTRAAVQARLLAALEELNRRLRRSALAARLRVVAGDEFQGLFVRPEAVVDVMSEVSEALHPARIAFGIGWGKLSTGALGRSPRVEELDGPCFHHARAALEHAKHAELYGAARGFGTEHDPVLSTLLELSGELRRAWTQRQRDFAQAMRAPRSRAADPKLRTQKEVAAEFEVRPSVISESLKASRFQHVVRAEQVLASYFGRFGENAESTGDSADVPKP
jgi:hypothetical protein